MKSSYSFEDRGTDGQIDGINFGLYSQIPLNDIYITCLS